MSRSTVRAAVVGDALLDVSVAHTSPIVDGGDVPASIEIGAGGQGANCAVRLARLGAQVTLATSIGLDPAGAIVRAALRADGVAVMGPPTSATGSVVVLTDAAGERTMLSQRVPLLGALAGTDWRPEPDGWLVLSGYPLLEAGLAAALGPRAAFDVRRAVLGCAVPAELRESWRSAVRELRPDLVILNLSEAMDLLDDAPGDPGRLAAAVGVAFGCVAVVTTSDAAAASTPGDPISVRRGAAAPAVDTTGAGDAFAAHLIVGLAEASWPPGRRHLAAALAAAMEYAARVSRVRGAQGRVAGERPPSADAGTPIQP